MTRPPDPCIVHALPTAPKFVGRERERSDLLRFWADEFTGIVALIGLGGSGKTALAAQFLDEVVRASEGALRPNGLFVWSFYREPDAGQFLRQAFQYFSTPSPEGARARGQGLLHLLIEALASGARHLLVLDGLERVQSAGEPGAAEFGRIDDPLLKTLLLRAAHGIGRSMVLITSRFPLTDFEHSGGADYRHVALGGLDAPAGVELLRSRGVRGDDEALRRLAENYGEHPLTLDHLGGLVGQFLDGDPSRAPELPSIDATADPQAARLSRLLRQYERHLPRDELELLMQLCLFRRSVVREQFISLLVCSPPVRAHTAREIAEAAQRSGDVGTLEEQKWRWELIQSARDAMEAAVFAARTAGPETSFRSDAIAILQEGIELQARAIGDEATELARRYALAPDSPPDDERPLSLEDRARFRELLARMARLVSQPTGVKVWQSLRRTLRDLGFAEGPVRRRQVDFHPADWAKAIRRASLEFAHWIAKDYVLRRLGELCRRYQTKWSRAGALAPLDTHALNQAIDSLVRRHLALCSEQGALEVHPAVRDHFKRLATSESQAGHNAIREQLLSLAQRPGLRLPEEPATLDLIEEAIYHALEAGRPDEALALYEQVLGGHAHLAWKLGEVARGLRIVRMFPWRENRWALGWYLRSLGEIEEAYRQHNMAYFRSDIRLLQGRLPEVAQEGDPHRTAVAALLMGQTLRIPDLELGCVIPRPQLYLVLGRPEQALLATEVADLYAEFGWEGDRARTQLLRADAEARHYHLADARQDFDQAAAWILHSGSMEHLALMHLVHARHQRICGNSSQCAKGIADGLSVALQCGFDLYRIELLCEQTILLLGEGQAEAAQETAREALALAISERCQFVWGALGAKHLLGEALLRRQRYGEAAAILDEAHDEARRLGHPRAEGIREALERIPR
ncbi:MAG TPA: ATP-binding protein [Pirellulales bacterium]|nr:ATP-binding protein [Pirellulales bacterium]